MKRIRVLVNIMLTITACICCLGCGSAAPRGAVKVQQGKYLIKGNSVVEDALKSKYKGRGFEVQSAQIDGEDLYTIVKQVGYDDEFTVNVIDGIVYDDYHRTVNKDITMDLVREVIKVNQTLDIKYDYEFILKDTNIVDGTLESYLKGNPGHMILNCKSYATEEVQLAAELYTLTEQAKSYGLYYIINCEWNGQLLKLDNTLENEYTEDDNIECVEDLTTLIKSGTLINGVTQ